MMFVEVFLLLIAWPTSFHGQLMSLFGWKEEPTVENWKRPGVGLEAGSKIFLLAGKIFFLSAVHQKYFLLRIDLAAQVLGTSEAGNKLDTRQAAAAEFWQMFRAVDIRYSCVQSTWYLVWIYFPSLVSSGWKYWIVVSNIGWQLTSYNTRVDNWYQLLMGQIQHFK